jgi:hypothetical protein
MADPLSVAGLATGAISLGLQLFETVKDYLDAVKGRSEEIASARQQVDNMRKLLETIRDLLPRLQTNHPASTAMIQHYVRPCEAELKGLNTLLLKLRPTTTFQSDIRSRVEEQRKKLSYPFNRAHVKDLEGQIEKVNSALKMALQLADLDISITTSQNLSRLLDIVVGTPQPALANQTVHSQRQLTNSTSNAAVMRLASKPSYLSDSLSELGSSLEVAKSRPLNQAACDCRPSRRITRRTNKFASLSFSFESSSFVRHLPDCPFAQILGDQHTQSLALDFDSLKSLLQKAVTVSFSLRRGAGGFSISPNFSYYPVVDDMTAPVFRVINFIPSLMFRFSDINQDALNSNSISTIEAYIGVVEYIFDQVILLFRRRKASPKDVNSQGDSLVHAVVERIVSYCF